MRDAVNEQLKIALDAVQALFELASGTTLPVVSTPRATVKSPRFKLNSRKSKAFKKRKQPVVKQQYSLPVSEATNMSLDDIIACNAEIVADRRKR